MNSIEEDAVEVQIFDEFDLEAPKEAYAQETEEEEQEEQVDDDLSFAEEEQGQEEVAEEEQEQEGEEHHSYSKAFTALSKKEKILRDRESQVKELESKYSKVADLADNVLEDPLRFIIGAIEASGGDVEEKFHDIYQAFTYYAVDKTLGEDAVSELKKEDVVDSLRKKMDDMERRLEDEKRRVEQEKIKQQQIEIEHSTKLDIQSNLQEWGGDFPLFMNQSDVDPVELIYKEMVADYNAQLEAKVEHPKMLSYQEVAQRAETALEGILEKYSSLVSVKSGQPRDKSPQRVTKKVPAKKHPPKAKPYNSKSKSIIQNMSEEDRRMEEILNSIPD